jgi:tetratricopeptide (TPR) repeat protein
MRFVIVIPTRVALRIGGLFVLLLASILPVAARPVGYFKHLHPITRVGHGGHTWIDARERSAFGYNDIIRTMGRGETMLVFNNGNILTLKPNTTIQIMPPRSAESPLVIRIFGALSGLVGRSNGQLQIVSAAGNAAARGTEFMVDLPTEDSMRVTVAEGAVDFSNPFGAVTVEAGKQSTARVGSAPTPPTAVDVSGLIQWAADITGLPVEFETPFITPDPAAAARLVAQRTGPARANPNVAPGHYQLGAALYDAGEYAAAVGEFQAALQLAPGTISYVVALGQARRGIGDAPGAIDVLQQALAAAPDDAQVRSALALAYLSQVYRAPATHGPATTRQAAAGAATTATTHVSTIALDRPTAESPAVPSGMVQAVITASERQEAARQILAPVQTQPLPEAILALVELHAGHAGRAVELCHDALRQQPDLYQAQALLALALLTENHVTEAVQAARRAEQLQPASAQVEGILSMTLFFSGETKPATQAAERAVKINPTSPFALLTMGRAYLAQQRLDDALESLQQAQALAPDLPVISTELGTAYLRLDRPQRAQKAFTHALALDPASATARGGLGAALQQQGKTAEARAAYDRALALEPHNATALANLALLLIEQGQLKEAQARLAEAVKIDPQFGIYYIRLSEVSLYQQDLIGARESARRGVELLPDSAVAHYQLGRVYLEQQRIVQAEQEFRQAVTLDPQLATARYALGLAQEKTEAVLLKQAPELFGPALLGSPGSSLVLEDTQTPGANERIQAAIADPTVIRTATRSYGDNELDGRLGEDGIRDYNFSHLKTTRDRRGVFGLSGERQQDGGVRNNGDSTLDRYSAQLGRKQGDGKSGLFLMADYEAQEQGLDFRREFLRPTSRFSYRLPRLIAGYNLQTSNRSETRFLIQTSRLYQRGTDLAEPDFLSTFDDHSFDAEVRHDRQLTTSHFLSAGFGLGLRTRDAASTLPPPLPIFPPFELTVGTHARQYHGYLRDEVRLGPRWDLTGEMQLEKLDYSEATNVTSPPLGLFTDAKSTTVGKPLFVATYRPTARSALRFRARRLFASISDFELLTPTDVFLISFEGLPQPTSVFVPASGRSLELEYDKTLRNASFLRIGAFDQHLSAAGLIDDPTTGLIPEARVRGIRSSYEGVIGEHLAFLLRLDLNAARGRFASGSSLASAGYLPRVPHISALVSCQYLGRHGYFAEPSLVYQGSDRDVFGSAGTHNGGFAVCNLRIGKHQGLRTSIAVELWNVLNKDYSVFDTVQARRQLRVVAAQRF